MLRIFVSSTPLDEYLLKIKNKIMMNISPDCRQEADTEDKSAPHNLSVLSWSVSESPHNLSVLRWSASESPHNLSVLSWSVSESLHNLSVLSWSVSEDKRALHNLSVLRWSVSEDKREFLIICQFSADQSVSPLIACQFLADQSVRTRESPS